MKMFQLVHHEARRRAAQYIAEAPEGYTVSISPPKRNSGQNAALHAWISEIAKTLTLGGQRHDSEVWKRALVAAWSRTRGESVLIIPAIDGQGVDLVPRRTSQLTKAECADLLEYVIAYAVEHGVDAEELDANAACEAREAMR